MRNLLDRLFSRINNLECKSKFKKLFHQTPVSKIFEAINSYSTKSEIRYVGGCIRKILKNEDVDDIDLATNLEPKEICEALKKYKINYHEVELNMELSLH